MGNREAAPPPPRPLPNSHILPLLVSSVLAGPGTSRFAPPSSPRPPSRGPSLTRATAAAGGEQAQPLKLPPGPGLDPGSEAGVTKRGAGTREAVWLGRQAHQMHGKTRCVHPVGLGGRARCRRGRRRTGSYQRHGLQAHVFFSSCPDLFRASPSTASTARPHGCPEQVRA